RTGRTRPCGRKRGTAATAWALPGFVDLRYRVSYGWKDTSQHDRRATRGTGDPQTPPSLRRRDGTAHARRGGVEGRTHRAHGEPGAPQLRGHHPRGGRGARRRVPALAVQGPVLQRPP